MFVVVCVATAILLLWLVPIRKSVLIEGKFHHQERYTTFCFYHYCRSCLEEWRRTGVRPDFAGSYCKASVPWHATCLDSRLSLCLDQPLKIVVWKNIFGTIRCYRIELSDFVWVDPKDEEERLEALANGFDSVEEFQKERTEQWHEEFWQEAMHEHGLTFDEAKVLEPLPMFMESLSLEAKRRGVAYQVVHDEMDAAINRVERKPSKLYFCNRYDFYNDIAKFFINNHYLYLSDSTHINECWMCNAQFVKGIHELTGESEDDIRKKFSLHSKAGLRSSEEILAEVVQEECGITLEEFRKRARERMILRYGCDDCFTTKERISYARTETLPAERLAHAETCIGCKRMISSDRAEFLATGKIGRGLP